MRLRKVGLHFYLVGLLILTLSISLAITSLLGTSPYDALLVGLFRSFGLSVGTWEVITGIIIIFSNALIARERSQYFVLVTSLVTGIGIDSWLFLFNFGTFPKTMVGQWICLILSLLFTALGIAIYIQFEVAPNPVDRSMLIISKATGINVTYARAVISVILVVIAFFLMDPLD